MLRGAWLYLACLLLKILHALLEPLRPLPTASPANDALPRSQLYQALDSLQPLSSVAAQQLQEMLSSLSGGVKAFL